jgi:hypothetical protein
MEADSRNESPQKKINLIAQNHSRKISKVNNEN